MKADLKVSPCAALKSNRRSKEYSLVSSSSELSMWLAVFLDGFIGLVKYFGHRVE